jgi:hypothetical protein
MWSPVYCHMLGDVNIESLFRNVWVLRFELSDSLLGSNSDFIIMSLLNRGHVP